MGSRRMLIGSETSDAETKRLAVVGLGQSVVKHLLTEGDRIVVGRISPLGDQGGYAIAINYGRSSHSNFKRISLTIQDPSSPESYFSLWKRLSNSTFPAHCAPTPPLPDTFSPTSPISLPTSCFSSRHSCLPSCLSSCPSFFPLDTGTPPPLRHWRRT